MTDRAYTVAEIDGLRRACENRYLWGRYSGPVVSSQGGAGMGRNYQESDKNKAVEEMVRTHMLAGHTAADLYESERND